MYQDPVLIERKKVTKNSTLLLIAFSTVFFARLFDSAGFPSLVNFIHFITVPASACLALANAKSKSKLQTHTATLLLTSLLFFFVATLISAIINHAGVINVVLSYLLWVEAFIFLCGFINIPFNQASLQQFKKWIFRFSLFHIMLALLQKVLLDLGLMKTTSMNILQDNIQGVFYLSGGGHVVAASVSISFAIYCFTQSNLSVQFKYLITLAAMTQLVVADAKQVLLVAFLSWAILIIVKFSDLRKFIIYSLLAVASAFILLWCMQNIEAFRGFNTWVRPEIYGPNGEATLLKSASIRIITSHHENITHYFFGLGPGHTVDRLGGWMLTKYDDLLIPLGATVHPVSNEVWDAVESSWLGGKSSMFSPLFGWAGLWGDVGIVGLVTYLLVVLVIWSTICVDDISRFFLLTICVNGLIFSQMQEPGFMLYTILLIGLRWQEQKLKIENKKSRNKLTG